MDPAGIISTVVTSPYARAPVVAASGDLYFLDSFGDRVRKVAPDGTVTTALNNTGAHGFGGDGGPATDATMLAASGLGLDRNGNPYIARRGGD